MSIVIRNIRKHKLDAVTEEVKPSAIKIRKLERKTKVGESVELPETKLDFQFLESIIIDNERF